MEAIITKILGVAKYTTKFFVILAVGSALLLFLPKEFIDKLGVFKFVTDNKQYIGLTFLVSGVVSISNMITFIYKKVTTKIRMRKVQRSREKRLHSLNPMEKKILLYYFVHGTNTQQLAFNDGTVRELEGCRIIQRTSQISQFGMNFPYNLNPWAREYLNDHPELLQIDEEEAALIKRELERDSWSW